VLRESKFTHDDTQVEKLLTSLTGCIPLTLGCDERHTLLLHRLPDDRSDIFSTLNLAILIAAIEYTRRCIGL
jgi:hypothetical protein